MDRITGISSTELIFKKLRGQISPQEEAVLKDRLEKSAEDRASFEEMSRIWNDSRPAEPQFYPDVDAAWQKVVAKNIDLKQEAKIVRLHSWKSFIPYAAAAVLLISVMVAGLSGWFGGPEMITVASGQEVKEVALPDGSRVWLNRNSELTYPESFEADSRSVTFKGEGYFEIAKDPERAFKIAGLASEIQILGTSFNYRSVAGQADDEVSVLTGKVRFVNSSTKKEVVLHAGDKASLSGTGIREQQVEDPNLLSWKNRKLIFSNTSMVKVAEQLERFFGKKVTVSDSLDNCRFTGTFEEPQLSQILEFISVTTDATITESNSEVHLSGRGCPDF